MPRRETEEPRAWQRMLSGRRLDLLNPSPLDIEIEDIAHGLARVFRVFDINLAKSVCNHDNRTTTYM